MRTRNRLLDDLARVGSGALGVASGIKEEVEARMRDQFERILDRMELVTRDEYEVVRAMAAKAREENERLEARVAALEKTAKKSTGAKTASRPRAAKKAPRKSAS